MKAFLIPLVVVASLLLIRPAQATNGQHVQTFNGCLTAGNGLFLLKVARGHTYALHGRIEDMGKYLDHTIQVQGTPEKPEDTNLIGAALRVKSWKVTGDCELAIKSLSRASPQWKKSGEPAVPIAGKTGPQGTAVPVTSNRSVGETTPPDYYHRNRISPPPPAQPGQPPAPEQIGQNPAAAERMAVAAQRAEIGTHNGTLGVPGRPGTGTLASQQSAAKPAVVIQMVGNAYRPAKVTISAGQTVEWKNTTNAPHTVTLEPDKALVPADAELPRNAQPFDSGAISAGMYFVHTFTRPGVYRYFCTLHESNGMVGEVVVK